MSPAIEDGDVPYLECVEHKSFQPLGWLYTGVFERLCARRLVTLTITNQYILSELGASELKEWRARRAQPQSDASAPAPLSGYCFGTRLHGLSDEEARKREGEYFRVCACGKAQAETHRLLGACKSDNELVMWCWACGSICMHKPGQPDGWRWTNPAAGAPR